MIIINIFEHKLSLKNISNDKKDNFSYNHTIRRLDCKGIYFKVPLFVLAKHLQELDFPIDLCKLVLDVDLDAINLDFYDIFGVKGIF